MRYPRFILGVFLSLAGVASSASAAPHTQLYTIQLADGRKATIYADGVAKIENTNGQRSIEYRVLREAVTSAKTSDPALMNHDAIAAELATPRHQQFVPSQLIVVFKDNVYVPNDVVEVQPAAMGAMLAAPSDAARASLTPAYTRDASTNVALARVGADRMERLARSFDRGRIHSMVAQARARTGLQLLDVGNAYRVHIVTANVRQAAAALRQMPSVAYAEPDWTVTSLLSKETRIPASASQQSSLFSRPLGSALSSHLPTNFGLTNSLSAFLNAPGVNAVAAFDEIAAKYGELPGQGETITNVSVGDVDNETNPAQCLGSIFQFGPTTTLIGGQQFLDLPSLPLIPAFVSDSGGNLSGSAEVCGLDPQDGEIGLDFSVMAPLPHNLQRPGEVGSTFTDLLGIAPGAHYRLVVPGTLGDPGNSDIVGALIAAALQTPEPTGITASLGFGFDQFGLPSRYLEEDELTRSVIASIVNTQNITVTIAGGDGLRIFTNAAVSPSGGAAETNLAPSVAQSTALFDVAESTAPSAVFDSGAFDVGGTTLDDIFAANPQDLRNAALASQHAFAETRFTGGEDFATAYGSRVNISAPGDGIVSLAHSTAFGHKNFDSVIVELAAGTSASAPEVAAATAVIRQVARLSGHPFATQAALRSFVASNGTAVPNIPEADKTLPIGPQIDLSRAIETLLKQSGSPVKPGVARVAVTLRQGGAFDVGQPLSGAEDTAFLENVDPTNINLQGPTDPKTGANSDENARSYLTIAPDWEGLPISATFELISKANPSKIIARGRSARMIAIDLLKAAGAHVPSASSQTLSLEYRALFGRQVIVNAPVTLTFGPVDATSELVLAPIVPSVVNITPGAAISVHYDMSTLPHQGASPLLLVSQPGRINPFTGPEFIPVLQIPLTQSKGVVNVPVDKLNGGGIYGIGILLDQTTFQTSDFALTRLTAGTARPPAPLLATSATSTPGHFLDVPDKAKFVVAYDVSNVAGATGAVIEFAFPGPNQFASLFTIDNPNGTRRDSNIGATGSQFSLTVTGTKGVASIDSTSLVPAESENVRVIPLKGATPIAEAGDASTVQVDGIVPASGAFIGGVGLQTNGIAGLMSTAAITASGQPISDVESFDQKTLAAFEQVSPTSLFNDFVPEFGVFGGTGLVSQVGRFPGATLTFPTVPNLPRTLNNGLHELGPAWTPPAFPNSTTSIFNIAPDHGTTTTAFLLLDSSKGEGANSMFLSDVLTSKSSAILDFSSITKSFGFAVNTTIDQIPSLNRAYGVFEDQGNCVNVPDTIGVADFTTNKVSSFLANGDGGVVDFKIDAVSQVGAILTDCNRAELHLINLKTQTPIAVAMVPGVVFSIAADEVNHRFLVENAGNLFTDNNAAWHVTVYDEQGHLVSQTGPIFNLFDAKFNVSNVPNFQVNGLTHQGIIPGDDPSGAGAFTQLQPFTYDP